MEIALRQIDQSNWQECVDLSVESAQRRFVAPNVYSLAQAAYEPETYPLAIYRGKEMAGFIMYGYDAKAGYWNMSRLLVDARFQKQGIGEAAVRMLLKLVCETLGHIRFYTHAVPENAAAISLYEKLGFCRTGKVENGDAEMVIQL